LGELMRGIFRLGCHCFPNPPDRLFAHQFGDGFLVISDFHEESLERCVCVAVALMRHVAASGRFCRASIDEGEVSDIQGCYPKEVRKAMERDLTVRLESGLMTINPVMGNALIRTVSVAKAAPRGPLLVARRRHAERFGTDVTTAPLADPELVSIDWVHMTSPLLSHYQATGGLLAPTASELEARLNAYCEEHRLPEEWAANARSLLGLKAIGA
jgi:hypothetical protein